MLANSEAIIHELLELAQVKVNGPDPWDIQVHNPALYERVLLDATLGLGEGIGPSIQSGINAANAIISNTPYTLNGISRYSFPALLRLRR